jgi:feruloyl esterase
MTKKRGSRVTTTRLRLLIVASAVVGAQVVSSVASAQTAAPGKLAVDCASLLKFRGDAASDPSVVITQATLRGKMTVKQTFGEGSAEVPPHCELIGQLRERTGAHGQRYAIRFHMRLPIDWNGRFMFEGGGGINGYLGEAAGMIEGPANISGLARGFAVVSQDSGHDEKLNDDPTRQGPGAFGHDFLARRDYGYASHEVVTRVAKAIIGQAYGRNPDFSYFVGCSKGGHEGMMMAQRYPTYFNGIIAGAPGFTLPKLALGTVWDVQAFAKVAQAMGKVDAAGVPLINKAYTDSDLTLVSKAVLKACDRLDYLADGIVESTRQCTTERVKPALAEITCHAGKTDQCLLPVQIQGLVDKFNGPKTSRGEEIYASWPWDPGIGGHGADGKFYSRWREFFLGTYDSPVNDAGIVLLSMTATSAIFTTPPTPVASTQEALIKWALTFDFDRDLAKIFLRTPEFPESPWDVMSASTLDRGAFRRAGGKLLLHHGASDEDFSTYDLMNWVEALDRVEGGKASDFVRFFNVPGMLHCSGGPSTDNFDALTPLVDWVEKGIAPNRIIASAGPSSPWPGRTRPLCPYPQQAVYNGTGSIEDANNFTCR